MIEQDEGVCPSLNMIQVRLCRRRPCTPACPKRKKYCAGRCVFAGKACLFAPCMSSPYRSLEGACSEMAFKTSEKGGKCEKACTAVDTTKGSKDCQKCLVKHLPGLCKKRKASACWGCVTPLVEDLDECHSENEESSDVERCVNERASTQCAKCTCKLLCSMMDPKASLCENCQKNL